MRYYGMKRVRKETILRQIQSSGGKLEELQDVIRIVMSIPPEIFEVSRPIFFMAHDYNHSASIRSFNLDLRRISTNISVVYNSISHTKNIAVNSGVGDLIHETELTDEVIDKINGVIVARLTMMEQISKFDYEKEKQKLNTAKH